MGGLYSDLSLSNESDVEQKFIYRLLTNAMPHGLGYNVSDFRTKTDLRRITIDKGNKKKIYYPDYAIIINGLPCIIIEAKSPGEDIDEALREARLYSTEINSSYKNKINPCSRIIATDGIRIKACHWDEDIPYIDLIIDDLDPINEKYNNFLSFASKNSIVKLANEYLSLLKSNAEYYKPVFMLGGKSVINETVGVNSFGTNVSFEYKYLFNPDDLADREDVVRNAYIISKRKESHVSPIDKIIKAATPKYEIDSRLVNDTSNPIEIIDQLVDTKKIRNEICLLIGSVGSGKSTFTDYLRCVALPKISINSTEWIHINLNKAPMSRDLIYNWLVDKIIESIKFNYKSIDFDHIDTLYDIYKDGLKKIKKGKASLFKENEEKYKEIMYLELTKFQSDPIYTLQCIINYIYTGQNKLLVIVLDNCDKRNKDDQLLMFEVTTWLKEIFNCMIFLPLRDTTYDQFHNDPPLDTVIKDLVFRIDPPLLERVIYARLHYAFRINEANSREFQYYLSNNSRVTCNRDEVSKYLKSIVTTLFQDQLFKRIIVGLAGRNIRKGLEIFLDFCTSGHINDDELFKIRHSIDYKLPSHLVSKILLKGKRKYYYDEYSYIKNMFYSVKDDALPDPFVRISILNWLKDKYRENGPNQIKGFHKVIKLISDLQAAGHSRDRIILELESLARAECIMTESHGDSIEEEDLVSISPGGFIHLDLLRNINYLSTISEDTYFRENQIAKNIADNIVGRGIYKQFSKQAALSNSSLLIHYMKDYYKNYFPGLAKVLNEDGNDITCNIDELSNFIDRIAENDSKFVNLQHLKNNYPPGKQVCAQIMSVQNYGLFIEFDLAGIGMIHKTQCDIAGCNFLDRCEEGDWLIAEIIEYNPGHERFLCKLIEF